MTAIAEHPAAAVLAAPAHRATPVARYAGTGRHRAVSLPRSSRRVLTRIAGIAGTALVVLTGLILLGMTVGPRVFHYQTATMLTGSMSPGIDPGDVIIDVQQQATAIKVGQIITYHIPVEDHRVESHRVTWVGRGTDGAVLFRTKGDANTGADPWTARATGAHVWRVQTVVPGAGVVIRFLRQPTVQLLLTRVLPFVLLGAALLAVWRRPSGASEADGTTAS